VPEERRAQLDWIRARTDESPSSFATSMDFDARFRAKLALGFGTAVLGQAYAESESANRVRPFLWDKDKKAQGQLFYRSEQEYEVDDALKRDLAWNGCHIFCAMPQANILHLYGLFYSESPIGMAVSMEPKHWRAKVPPMGAVWVVEPVLRRCTEPMDLGVYLAARPNSSGPLAPLQAFIDAAIRFPPDEPEVSDAKADSAAEAVLAEPIDDSDEEPEAV
jgi:hypothetical protein